MSTIPRPSEASNLASLTDLLDAASHEERVAWARSLGEKEQKTLYAMAAGTTVVPDDLVSDGVLVHYGRNGLPFFNLFQKRFARLDGEMVGFNFNGETAPSLIAPIFSRITGPGHFTFYPSPDVEGEVWIDYRVVPTKQHPEFPALVDNDGGLRCLVYGNMVDVLRRVSKHVFIGDSYKNLSRGKTLGSRIGSMFPTAPFILAQAPR